MMKTPPSGGVFCWGFSMYRMRCPWWYVLAVATTLAACSPASAPAPAAPPKPVTQQLGHHFPVPAALAIKPRKIAVPNEGPSVASKDPDNAMLLECTVDRLAHSDLENARLYASESENAGQAAASLQLKPRPTKTTDRVRMRIRPGETAECRYPSGTHIRVRASQDISLPYGFCGVDPSTFVSLWVNHRKVLTKEWMSGHCFNEFNENQPLSIALHHPDATEPLTIERCKHLIYDEDHPPPETGPVSLCVPTAALQTFPLDAKEFAKPYRSKPPKPRMYALLRAKSPVCRIVEEAVGHDSGFLDGFPPNASSNIEMIALPFLKEQNAGIKDITKGFNRGAVFDFDNDGIADQVRMIEGNYHYFDGAIALVNLGRKRFGPDAGAQDANAWFVPCQFRSPTPAITDCAMADTKISEGRFPIQGARDEKNRQIFFYDRYTTLSPFRANNRTYLLVTSIRHPEVAVIIEPLPEKRSRQVCLFKDVALRM